jgi:hypothetical protein
MIIETIVINQRIKKVTSQTLTQVKLLDFCGFRDVVWPLPHVLNCFEKVFTLIFAFIL